MPRLPSLFRRDATESHDKPSCPTCGGGAGRRSQREEAPASVGETARRLLIVGSPNVGKSVLFSRLTGTYAVVSNYPGTTVEVTRGRLRLGDTTFEVIDTPGMYSLRPISDEERVARRMVLDEPSDAVLHVVDAKNLDRMLAFTLQLLEAGLPLMLVVNMQDEARRLGVKIDLPALEKALGIPVVGTSALTGQGMDELRERLDEYTRNATCTV